MWIITCGSNMLVHRETPVGGRCASTLWALSVVNLSALKGVFEERSAACGWLLAGRSDDVTICREIYYCDGCDKVFCASCYENHRCASNGN